MERMSSSPFGSIVNELESWIGMAEQYVFSVAFDSRESDVPQETNDTHSPWTETLQALDRALLDASLGALESDRWEEFGNGRIFWGTRAECASVREILQRFDIEIEDERNIETGYYNTDDALYYVTEPGDILCIDGACTPAIDCIGSENSSTSTVQSMPLDAYPVLTTELDAVARFRTVGTLAFMLANQVDPNLPPSSVAKEETVAALASILTASTHTEGREEDAPASEESEIAPPMVEPTGSTYFDAIASETIHSNTVSSLETRISMLEADLATRPEPARVEELERQLLEARAEAQTALEGVSREKGELVEQLGTQSRALEEWNARFADLEAQASAELMSTRQDLQAQIADRDREIAQLQEQKGELQAAQTAEAETLRQQLNEREQSLSTVEAQLSQVRTQLEVRVAPDVHRAVQDQLESRTEELASLQAQVAEARSQDADAVRHSTQQLEEKTRAVSALEAQLSQVQVQLHEVERQASERTETVSRLEAELTARPTADAQRALQDQLDAQTETIAQLERQLAANRADSERQLEAIDGLERQLATVRSEADTLNVGNEKLEALQQALQQAQKEAAARVDPIEHRTLKRKSAALVGQMKQLQVQLAKAQEPKGLWASLKKRFES